MKAINKPVVGCTLLCNVDKKLALKSV